MHLNVLSANSTMGDIFYDFLFTFMNNKTFSERSLILTHSILLDSSTVICWMSLVVILGVSGLFRRFYSIFDLSGSTLFASPFTFTHLLQVKSKYNFRIIWLFLQLSNLVILILNVCLLCIHHPIPKHL